MQKSVLPGGEGGRKLAMVLVVEDDLDFRELVAGVLSENGYRVDEAPDGETALQLIGNTKYDVIICDVKLPGISGMDVLREAKSQSPDTEVLIMTSYGSVDSAVKSMKMGGFDYLQKPFGLAELEMRVEKAVRHRMLCNEVSYLRHERDIIYRFEDIIGRSHSTRELLEEAEHAAMVDGPVLLYGEPGTGRKLIAGAIHYNSERHSGGFVRVNSAGMRERYLAGDLFGHVRGAFDGAGRARTGRFEQANDGTILLEEISHVSLDNQDRILEFLETGKLLRIGHSKSISLDVRLIATSSTDLGKKVREGGFREELYSLISVTTIRVPPLRSRKEDIPLLAEYFLRSLPKELMKQDVVSISSSAFEKLTEYPWPGNIRELKNVIERSVLTGTGEIIEASDIQLPDENAASSGYSGLILKEMEKAAVVDALRRANFVQKDAAKILGISKRVMHYKIQQFGIKHPRWIKNR